MQAVKDRLAGFFSPLTASYLWRRLFPAQCWGRWPRSCWVPHPASQKLPWLPNLYGPAQQETGGLSANPLCGGLR